MKTGLKLLFYLLMLFAFFSCSEKTQTENLLRFFLDKHVERIKPINKSCNEAVWATYSGEARFSDLLKEINRTDSIYMKGNSSAEYYQNLLNNLYNNSSEFEILEKIEKSGFITDPSLRRQLVKVFRNYIAIKNHWDETEKRRTTMLDKFYDLKKRENSYFDSITNEPANEKRARWIKEFSALTNDFREVIKSVNKEVRVLGYENYFAYLMDNSEIPIRRIDQMIDSIDLITRDDYRQLLEICRLGMCNHKCNPNGEMTPYQLLCAHSKMVEPKEWSSISYTKEQFIENIKKLYASGGFSIDSICRKSDIWYRKEKVNNSFFFCVDFDESDFRIYSNSQPTAQSLNPMIHEFGHALHYQSIGKEIPYFLKDPNPIISEAIAIYFDSKIYSSEIIQDKLELPCLNKNIFFRDFSNPSQLIFLRKLLRSIKFEKAIYENPDQDFNALWWRLNKEYLFIDPAPADRLPEWITSIHLINSAGVNVDYLFAIAYAAQLEHYFPDDQFAPIKERVMKYGDSVPWNELILQSTGEPLNLTYLRGSYMRCDSRPEIVSQNVVGKHDKI